MNRSELVFLPISDNVCSMDSTMRIYLILLIPDFIADKSFTNYSKITKYQSIGLLK